MFNFSPKSSMPFFHWTLQIINCLVKFVLFCLVIDVFFAATGNIQLTSLWFASVAQRLEHLSWDWGVVGSNTARGIWFFPAFILYIFRRNVRVDLSDDEHLVWSMYGLLTNWPSVRSRWLDIGQALFLRVYGPRWSSQSQREIRFILPAHGASHIIKYTFAHCPLCEFSTLMVFVM